MVDVPVRSSIDAVVRAVRDEWPTENRRPTTFARRGIVASAQPLAAVAGVRVLAEGGNAFDAAIATALVEGVVLPPSCGLGGDMFGVLYDARAGEFWAINGSGVVPHAASAAWYRDHGYERMPLNGLLSVGVPGAVDAYLTLHERFGTQPLERLFEPAIEVASGGWVVSPKLAAGLRSGMTKKLGDVPTSVREFTLDGRVPRAGDVLRRPNLARTLEIVLCGGRAAFYEGTIAEQIVAYSQRNGGLFSRDDFAEQRSEVYTPIKTSYRGVDVYQTRPVSQGLIMLETLNLLEGFSLAEHAPDSADVVHLIAEAKKIAFADRLASCGDPRFVDIPLDRLISKQHAERRRSQIDPERAAPIGAWNEQLDGDTSYFCAVDGQGNAISFIHSLSAAWGSGVVAGDTGILLNNRAGRGFSLEDGHPNLLVGGRRTMHTLNCYLLAEDDRAVLVGGTPGGDQQPQWNVQMLVGMLDHGRDPQSAIEAPRWYSFPGTDPANQGKPSVLRLESRFPEDTVAELQRRGHQVELLGPWSAGGSVQLIALDHERGVQVGATDPRTEGVALGL